MISEKLRSALADGTITKIYSGQDNCCRCGCRGKYYNKGDKMFAGMVRKAVKLATTQETEEEYNFINIPYGNNRAYTIYID